jgi:hypothetical protein
MARRSALWLFAGVVVVGVVGYYAFTHRKVCGYVAGVTTQPAQGDSPHI